MLRIITVFLIHLFDPNQAEKIATPAPMISSKQLRGPDDLLFLIP
jgi:hypothetical protein